MSLRQKQSRFVFKVAELIIQAKDLGYQVTLGDGYRDPRLFKMTEPHPYSSPSSRHTMRLAVDLNLFVKRKCRWTYCEDTEDYTELGEYWESLGGIWGGRFDDGNHFEWPL